MKKAMSIIFATALSLTLISCSEKAGNSKNDKDYTTLNSTWECDYLKIGTNSNWSEYDSLSDYSNYASWSWKDSSDEGHSCNLNLSHSSLYKKLSQSDAIKYWEWSQNDFLTSEEFKGDQTITEKYKDYFVEDSFVKNGQSYLIISKKGQPQKRIEFYAEGLHGDLSYNSDDEPLIMDMINSIVFY